MLLAECILLWSTVLAEDCPYPCVCFFNADEERTLTVDCRNQELFEIPLGVPPTTTHLLAPTPQHANEQCSTAVFSLSYQRRQLQ